MRLGSSELISLEVSIRELEEIIFPPSYPPQGELGNIGVISPSPPPLSVILYDIVLVSLVPGILLKHVVYTCSSYIIHL